jgi:Leucine-rich repeat (LRR) protein
LKSSNSYRFKSKTIACILLALILVTNMSIAQNKLLDSLTLDTLKAFTNLEQALKEPEKVIKLVLRRDKLKTFPPEIFQFTNLQYLDLSKNDIKEIPYQISSLKDLQYFAISRNHLIELPAQIGELTNLYYLNANQNDLYGIPPEIGKLVKLRNLDLWDNNIGELPDEIKNCTALKIVDLRAIMIKDSEQTRIQLLLKHTKVHFSPYCNCQQ